MCGRAPRKTTGGGRCPEAATGTLRTRRPIPAGVCTVPAATSVQSPFQTWSVVYKAASAEKPSVQTSAQAGSPVYKAGLCALNGLHLRLCDTAKSSRRETPRPTPPGTCPNLQATSSSACDFGRITAVFRDYVSKFAGRAVFCLRFRTSARCAGDRPDVTVLSGAGRASLTKRARPDA